MCTKIPYPNRWQAYRAVEKLREKGQQARSIHPCFENHKGHWHVTSMRGRNW